MMPEEEIRDLLDRIHRGQVDPFNLPTEVFRRIVDRLLESFEQGFGAPPNDLPRSGSARRIGQSLVSNIRIFSAAKTFQQVKDMSEQVTDADGMKRPFHEFEKIARSTFDNYNRHWLNVEQRTAFNASASGKNWSMIEENKDLFPMLMYKTQGDDLVRDEHEAMEGIVKAVDDPFWDTFYPPNGFNCRCPKPRQMRSGTPTDARSAPEPHPLFKMNPGKDGMAFKEDVGDGLEHPYFRVDERYEVVKENGFGFV